jgi:ribosome-associated protein
VLICNRIATASLRRIPVPSLRLRASRRFAPHRDAACPAVGPHGPFQKESAISRKTVPPAVRALVKLIETSLDADKAQEIVTVPLAGKTTIADFMVVASGTSARHLTAMADHLAQKLKTKDILAPVEGKRHGEWILVDAGDVIVHLFRPEARAHYAIEKMWDAAFAEPARRARVA